MKQSKATASAHPNIALIKYWGKRDEDLILPHQSSLSVTLAPLTVTTTVEFGSNVDRYEVNGLPATESEIARIRRVLKQVELISRLPLGGIRVVSRGNFPQAAGLASSAAGFAALAIAAQAAAKIAFSVRQSSILARLGSGSAARSIEGGFCQWHRGLRLDGEDSFAEQLHPESFWPELRLAIAVISPKRKSVSSREGMRRTVETSPFFPAWVANAEVDLSQMRAALLARELSELGQLCERNAWRMHATALAADPSLCYFEPDTLRIIQALTDARRSGLRAWFTLDAGPNPVFLTDESSEESLLAFLRDQSVKQIIRCRPGGSAQITSQDLF